MKARSPVFLSTDPPDPWARPPLTTAELEIDTDRE
jgi:hypothetical protein